MRLRCRRRHRERSPGRYPPPPGDSRGRRHLWRGHSPAHVHGQSRRQGLRAGLRDIVVAIMIEKPGTVDTLEDVLAVRGVDVVQWGVSDSSWASDGPARATRPSSGWWSAVCSRRPFTAASWTPWIFEAGSITRPPRTIRSNFAIASPCRDASATGGAAHQRVALVIYDGQPAGATSGPGIRRRSAWRSPS